MVGGHILLLFSECKLATSIKSRLVISQSHRSVIDLSANKWKLGLRVPHYAQVHLRLFVIHIDYGQVLIEKPSIYVFADKVLQGLILRQVVLERLSKLVVGLIDLNLDLTEVLDHILIIFEFIIKTKLRLSPSPLAILFFIVI